MRDSDVIASFPAPIPENPYQRLLYAELENFGFVLAPPARFRFRWIWRFKGEVSLLHFHWITPYYRHRNRSLEIIRLVLFGARLWFSRALRYRIIWTVHELYPYDTASLCDRLAPKVVARMAHVLIVHDEHTLDSVRRGVKREAIVIPHASYAGVYPRSRSRSEVRKRVGVTANEFLFLCFGHVRQYKGLDLLLRAFSGLEQENIVLLIAGMVTDPHVGQLVRKAASTDRRLRLELDFVPDDSVADLFAACDAAVLPRQDGGTSGALVLARSMGVPMVVADSPGYRRIAEDAAWYFAPNDVTSLTAALRAAAEDSDRARTKADLARNLGSRLDFQAMAAATAAILRDSYETNASGHAGDEDSLGRRVVRSAEPDEACVREDRGQRPVARQDGVDRTRSAGN